MSERFCIPFSGEGSASNLFGVSIPPQWDKGRERERGEGRGKGRRDGRVDPEGSGRGGRSVDVEKALVLAGELGDPAGKEGAGVGSGGHCEGLSRGAGRREVVLILRERERRGAGEWRGERGAL